MAMVQQQQAAQAQMQQQVLQLMQQNQQLMETLREERERSRSRSRSTGRDSLGSAADRGRSHLRRRSSSIGRSASPHGGKGGRKGKDKVGKGHGSRPGYGSEPAPIDYRRGGGGGGGPSSSSQGQEKGKGKEKGSGKRARLGGHEERRFKGSGSYPQRETGFFTGSQKATRATDKCLSSDSEDDVIMQVHRFHDVFPWEAGSMMVTLFGQVSNLILELEWEQAAAILKDHPELCAMRVPEDAEVAPGYGLIHTLRCKSTPDWLTDYVLHRTPWELLSISYND